MIPDLDPDPDKNNLPNPIPIPNGCLLEVCSTAAIVHAVLGALQGTQPFDIDGYDFHKVP